MFDDDDHLHSVILLGATITPLCLFIAPGVTVLWPAWKKRGEYYLAKKIPKEEQNPELWGQESKKEEILKKNQQCKNSPGGSLNSSSKAKNAETTCAINDANGNTTNRDATQMEIPRTVLVAVDDNQIMISEKDEDPVSTAASTAVSTVASTATNDEPYRIVLPPLPLTSQLVQCILWSYFSLYIDHVLALVLNTIGAICASVLLTFYVFLYKPEWYQKQLFAQIVFVILICSVTGVLEIIFWRQKEDSYEKKDDANYEIMSRIIGYLAMSLGIVLLISPVPVLCRAIKLKNVDILGSAVMNYVTLSASTLWFIEGYFYIGGTQGIPIWIQNGTGVLGMIATLSVRFYINKKIR